MFEHACVDETCKHEKLMDMRKNHCSAKFFNQPTRKALHLGTCECTLTSKSKTDQCTRGSVQRLTWQ